MRALAPKICRSGQPERVDDYGGLTGRLAERLQQLGIASGVGAPIIFRRRVWGFGRRVEHPDPRVRGRAPSTASPAFTELVAQALANAEAREQLAASRARVVAAGDGERRRLERNLHDGAQQRLVALAIGLRIADRLIDEDPAAAHAAIERASEELSASLAELRELARGLHPAVLSDHGLEPAIEVADAARADPGRADRRPRRAPAGGGRGRGVLRDRRVADQRRQVRPRVARQRRGPRARRPPVDRGQRRRGRRR